MKAKQPQRLLHDGEQRRPGSRLALSSLVLALIFTLMGPALSSSLQLPTQMLGNGVLQAQGAYSGTAFRDFNADGVQNAQEPGLGGVIATLYDSVGGVVGTATTDADGNYTIDTTGSTGPYRIEFTLPGDPNATPGELVDFMRPGAAGGTTVQFLADGGATNVDVGFNNPGQYAPDAPLPIAIAEHSSGYRYVLQGIVDPTITRISENYGSDATDIDPAAEIAEYFTPAPDPLVDHEDTGAIWAMAYDRSNEVIYAGSFLRRFVPLKNNPTTIHRVDVSAGTVSDWIQLDPGRLDPRGAAPNWLDDFDVIDLVGKEGLGGIKISDDGRTLYAVDLGERTLYVVPINDDGNAGTPTTIPLANGVASPYSTLIGDCAVNEDFRPFGLGYRDGTLYVGAVCSGESTANDAGLPISSVTGSRVGNPEALRGYVLAYDGVNWTLQLNFPMTYERGIVNRQAGMAWALNESNNARWATWVYTYPFTGTAQYEDYVQYPQPIISEIEFDNNGDMILGVMDRYALMDAAQANRPTIGMTTDTTAAGDILRACRLADGSWDMENLISGNTACDTAGAVQHTIPPVGTVQEIDEYYFLDQYFGLSSDGDGNEPNHSEVAQGALVQIPGRDYVVTTAQDPNFNLSLSFWRSGLHWYNNSDGSFVRGYQVRDEENTNGLPNLGKWAKAGGLGDVEPLVPPAPIEIGNRVWVDENLNGRQDANENGLAGVIVQLYREIPDVGMTLVAQTTTDAQGLYLFSFEGNGNSPTIENWNFTNDSAVLRNVEYQVRIELSQTALTTPGYSITAQNSAAAGGDSTNNFNTDLRDSDGDNGIINPGFSTIAYTTGGAGENNHTLDFGVGIPRVRYDWGDLPDGINGSADYATLDANSGPFHPIDDVTYMGAGVDDETDGQPNATATGDDAGNTDDEDGVTFGAPLLPDTTVTISITTETENGTGALSLFIDFNGDGNFSPAEYILTDELVTDGVQPIQVTVPGDATGIFGVRARFTSGPNQGGAEPTFGAETGEVEDYILSSLGDYVWVDANEDGIQNDGAASGLNGVTVALLDANDNVLGTTTTANDAGNNPGYYEFPGLIPGTPYSVRFTAPSGYVFTTANNGDDAADSDANENTGQTMQITLTPGENNPTLDAGLVQLVYDWGDLPDASGTVNPNGPEYNTDSTGTTGPSHVIIDTLRMGAAIDNETNGQPSADATGDDANGTPDDEDAVTLPTFLAGNPATVAVDVANSTGSDATLYGFIDFNGDGDFADAGESVTAVVADGTNGAVNLTFNVPLDADTTQQLGARFRLSTDTGLSADGPATNGEIEDYLITIDLFDLALRKQLAAGQPTTVQPGDDVNFVLTIFNQGSVDAFNIEVIDYLTTGFSLSPNDNNGWVAAGDNVINTIAALATGQQTTLNIVLRVDAAFQGDSLTNWAEISAGDNDNNPQNTPPTDVDSTPDRTNQNQPGEQDGTLVDDEVTQNGKNGGDEDDHDPAQVTLIRYDWGDLPDASGTVNPNGPEYNTDSTGTTGPSHVIIDTLRMGAAIDNETNGQPSADATGDDANGTPDDEDAVTLPTFLAGNPATVAVDVTNSTGSDATLYGFIDFNGDGDFADAGESVTAVVADGTNGAVNLTFNVPLDADTTQQLGARFRLSTDTGLSADGPATNGEIEDYLIEVQTFDLALRKQLAAGQSATVQPGDDVNFVLTVFNQGSVDAFNIEVIDYLTTGFSLSPNDNNGWVAAGDNVINTIAALAAGQQTTLNIVLRVDAAFQGDSLTNWAEISAGDNDSNPQNTPPTDVDSTPDRTNQNQPGEQDGTLVDDEVTQNGKNGGDEDDHDPAQVTVQIPTFDRGDLPDGIAGSADYATLLANNGPSHLIDGVTFLGATVDADNDGQPNASATGDDVNGTPDDEDGVVFTAPLMPGTTVPVQITTNTADGSGELSLFIDFNGDGDFGDAGEEILRDEEVLDGVQTVPVAVPADASGVFGVRARFTTFANQGGGSPTGPAQNGEVEDYILAALGDYVWVDANGNGTQDEPASSGLNGVTVRLLDANGTFIAATTTANDANGNPGYYEFPGLLPNTPYSVQFTPPAGYAFTTQTGNVNDAANSDADVNTGITAQVTLTPGEYNPNVDAGLVQLVFDLALRKQLAATQPASVEPGDDVTFTITVFNQGNVDAFNIQVTDYLTDSLTLSPNDNNSWTQSGNNVVNTVASLAAGQQTTLNIVLRIAANYRGDSLTNWAEISSADDDTNPNNTPPTDVDSTPDSSNQNTPGEEDGNFVDDEVGQNGKGGGDEDDHDPAIITVDQLPSVQVTKVLETPNPVQVGAEITFSIRITNTGPTTIVTLPLTDTYEPEFITFVRSIPTHDRVGNGDVEWFDLTTVLGDLAPGASVEVKVVFTADKPTPTTINIATVVNALDEDDKPSGSGSSTGVIIQEPTLVELLSFTATGLDDTSIQVAWVTGLEIDTWGFHVWRSATGNRADAVRITTDLIRATGSDSSYRIVDRGLAPGTYTYWLAETQTDGVVLEYGPVSGSTGGNQPLLTEKVFLPMLGR